MTYPIKDLEGNVHQIESQAPKTDRKDMVNHPSHYADKGIEVIDYIRDTLSTAGFTEYCCGNVLKYVSRWRKKGGVEDLKKAQVYLGWAIESAEKEAEESDALAKKLSDWVADRDHVALRTDDPEAAGGN